MRVIKTLVNKPRQIMHRQFSNKIKAAIAKQFGQDIGDEEFLPEKDEAEMSHAIKMETTMFLDRKLKNNELQTHELGGKLYKYELPVVNERIMFRSYSALM